MKLEFRNFGQAGDGLVALSDLTLICGPNSSGKTYTSYAVYAALKHFNEFFDFEVTQQVQKSLLAGDPASVDLKKIVQNFDGYIKSAGKTFAFGLDRFFNAPDDFFSETSFKFHLDEGELAMPDAYSASARIAKDAKIEVELDTKSGHLNFAYTQDKELTLPRRILTTLINDLIYNAILEHAIPSPFVVTSERTGVALFYKDLDYNSNAIVSHLRDSDKIDPLAMIEAMRSRYARPIQDNIDTVRDYENISKRKSFLKEKKDDFKGVFEALNDLLGGGTFKSQNGQLAYSPRKKPNKPKVSVPLYIASSSVKSLFLIDMYVNHVAQENQILIIDEPELNLHPDNQVKIARLIARLVNSGVKVLVTTHSDYIVREINNLISLSSTTEDKKNLMQKYKLRQTDILNRQQVRAYCADPMQGLCEMSVSETGIETSIFDNIIAEENLKAQDIHFSVN